MTTLNFYNFQTSHYAQILAENCLVEEVFAPKTFQDAKTMFYSRNFRRDMKKESRATLKR